MFKQLFLLTALLIILSGCDSSFDPGWVNPIEFEFLKNVEVGKQPSKIYYDEATHTFHVFCLGVDLNWDGIKDAGDENPSWWIIDKNDTDIPQKKMEFNFGSMGLPFRPAVDFDEGLLFISQDGKIKTYNMNNYSFIEDVGDYWADAISKIGDFLFLSMNPIQNDNGEVLVYNYKTNEEFGKIQGGLYTKQTVYYESGGKKILAIVSEGLGNGDAMLQFAELKQNSLELVRTYSGLGNYGNFLAYNGNQLAYILNGSHEIMLINPNDFSVTQTINTGTDAFNGPREAVFNSTSELLVSTYNKDFRLINLNSGNVKEIYPVVSKAEGLCLVKDELLLVCNISNVDYTPGNVISVFQIK